jgi:hypothetical protein
MDQWLISGRKIKMKTAIIYGPTDIRVEDVDIPEIGSDGELL